MRLIKEIIIHCSDTPFNKDFSAYSIDCWHRERGFKCIGYHYVIRLDGTIENGRSESVFGAHCLGHNSKSIGICYIGGRLENGKHGDSRTLAQKISLRNLLRELHAKYPDAKVYGHRDFSNKECPCFDVHSDDYCQVF